MRIQQLSINSIVSQNREKIFETFERRRKNRHSGSEGLKVFGTVKRRLLWFFLVATVIVGSVVVSSEKTFANGVTEDYHQYPILPPPNPSEEIAMKDVLFDFNSSKIKDSAKAVLKENAEVLKSDPDIVVFIQGYCDSMENTDENLGLKRAVAVNGFFVKQGVDPQRVKSVDKCNESYGRVTTYASPWRLDRIVHFIPFRVNPKAFNVAIY